MSDLSEHLSPAKVNSVPSELPTKHVGHRVPPNLFGIPLGIVGLADAWGAAAPILGSPRAIAHVLDVIAAVIWLAILVVYAKQGPKHILGDLRDPVLAPFVPLTSITAMLLAPQIAPYALTTAEVLVVIFLVLTITIGGWLTGQWIVGEIEQDAIHPGYFLPTVAGGLIGAFAAASVHLRGLAEASFGIGVLCWFLLGSIVLNRLFTRKMLATPLIPTMAIEFAPPAVGGIAYAAIHPEFADPLGYALAGYAVLMALVQIRLIPTYAKLKFTPGFWAFTFSYAAGVTDALEWIDLKRPAGSSALAGIAVALVSALILAIAVRTVVAASRGQLLPAVAPRQPVAAPTASKAATGS